MNYTKLKDQMQEKLEYYIALRASIREQTEEATNFEYAKITGQIIAMYEAIIIVQDIEIDELIHKEVN